jgi:hypothetical protein
VTVAKFATPRVRVTGPAVDTAPRTDTNAPLATVVVYNWTNPKPRHRTGAFSMGRRDVRSWHETDLPTYVADVRC